MNYTDYVILIPAYNPDETLLGVVSGLREQGFKDIVIVNDGSEENLVPIFDQLAHECDVLTHVVNLGKGRALKTGFNHIARAYPDHVGIVTVDADGQHLPKDVVAVAEKLDQCQGRREGCLVIGQREFKEKVPLRSLVGNVATKYVFYFFVGQKLEDTQSGLRGVPMAEAPRMLKLNGEGYEYEMNMLVQTKIDGLSIEKTPMETVYIEENKSSHFNPLFDSLKIYFVFLRFVSSSLLSSLLDLAIYSIFILGGGSVFLSLFVARAASSLVNFYLNKNYVFLHRSQLWASILKYYALVLFIFLMSLGMVTSMVDVAGINPIPAKVLSETVLFIISFLVQRALVFARKRPDFSAE